VKRTAGEAPLAVLGAKPRFSAPLPVGQFYWPAWSRYEDAARAIFARRFYTSQRFAGPLVVEFQRRLQDFLGVKHAVAVRNSANGLMIVAHTLGLRGKVIVPAWVPIGTVRSLEWSKCRPVFCDIDPESQQISCGSVRSLLEQGEVEGILAAHLWGNVAPVGELQALAKEFGVALYCDAAHAFGCRVNDEAVGSFGRAEVFSFHAANILSTAEGACIVTNDDELAWRFKAMRGDETSRAGVAMQSATARMSEMQAAIGLMMLDDFEGHRRNNQAQHDRYEERLRSIPGIRLLKAAAGETSNLQCLVGVVDESAYGLARDELITVLRAENIAAERQFHPVSDRLRPFLEISLDGGQLKNTEAAARTTFQLPIGAPVGAGDVERICDVLQAAHVLAEPIKAVPALLAAK
jgi:dTDP-4-amino-4,6-dideoxygalactose transaminase